VRACLHNLEEAVSYPLMRPEVEQLVQKVAPEVQLPATGDFQLALLLLTVAVAVLLYWAAKTRHENLSWIAIKAVAVVLLANILAPHLPAAVALGGYAPGVVTAVAVNLPIGLWVLSVAPRRAKARRKG
jgi:hypothetical protein